MNRWWMDGWTSGCMDQWVDGWLGGWVDEWVAGRLWLGDWMMGGWVEG